MNWRWIDVQSLAEVESRFVEGLILERVPQVKLITAALAAEATVAMQGQVGDEVAWRVATPEWAVTAQAICKTFCWAEADLEGKAQICADLCQRSSSCVEGRNGQLSLKHHALHRFTWRKLRALTVLHNYPVRRADGTTAAEEFCGTPPRDLFAWLLDRLSIPARPHARRRAA